MVHRCLRDKFNTYNVQSFLFLLSNLNIFRFLITPLLATETIVILTKNVQVKSLLTNDVNDIVLQQLLLIKTPIASVIRRLNVRYLQTVIAHGGVVDTDAMTQILINLTINIDIVDRLSR